MRAMSIEELLRWAYRLELPKANDTGGVPLGLEGSFSSTGGGWETGMVVIDNSHGVVADLYASGPPHADALLVSDAVRRLDILPIDYPDNWNPVADLGLSDTELANARAAAERTIFLRRGERAERFLKRGLSRLVIKVALLGNPPEWEACAPERKLVCGANGKPCWFRMTEIPYTAVDGSAAYNRVETNGYDEKRKRPHPDAYRKIELSPDPAIAVADRAEYELWAFALALLADELNRTMKEHRVDPSSVPPMRPWETGDARAIRVLDDLRPHKPIPGRPANMTREGGRDDERRWKYMHLGMMGVAMQRAMSTARK